MKTKLFTLCIVALCATTMNVWAQPTVSAPVPPERPANKVISIFSDAYSNIPGVNYRPDWGQSTIVEQIKVGEDNVLKYSNLNYEGTEFPEQMAATMTHIHIDIWSATAGTMNLYPINKNAPEGGVTEQAKALTLTGGQWDSFDIPLADYDKMKFDALWQFKVADANVTELYIDNWYLYDESTDEDNEAPTDLTVTVGECSYNSIQLKMTATDNSGAVIYDITYNDQHVQAGGLSGEESVKLITPLEEDTEYTFNINVKDAAGNVGETKTVKASTLAGYAKPTTAAPVPTYAADEVMSIYSDVYTSVAAWGFGYWGQTTTWSDYKVGDDNMIKLENFNFLGIEINGNVPLDYSGMKYLHIDVWTPNAETFQISPIGEGETLVDCVPLEKEQWNSYDILMTRFTDVDPSKIYQLKLVATGKEAIAYIDNIYFYPGVQTGVDVVSSYIPFSWKSNANGLMINNSSNEAVTVYTLTGRQTAVVSAQSEQQVALPQGVYLLKTNTNCVKAVVK